MEPLAFGYRSVRRVTTGGMRGVARKLCEPLAAVICHASAQAVVRQPDGRLLLRLQDGTEESYDHAVIATQAKDALRLLQDPLPEQTEALRGFAYERSDVVLHRDAVRTDAVVGAGAA